jgi:DNA-directed RNA polymerase specialized sigma24 family protein
LSDLVFLEDLESVERYTRTCAKHATIKCAEDREDIAQQALIVALRYHKRHGHWPPKTWQADNVRHRARDLARSSWKTRVKCWAKFNDHMVTASEGKTPDVIDAVELLEAVTQSPMPDTYADALAYNIEGYTAEEASEELGISVPSYKSNLYRAREKCLERVGGIL